MASECVKKFGNQSRIGCTEKEIKLIEKKKKSQKKIIYVELLPTPMLILKTILMQE